MTHCSRSSRARGLAKPPRATWLNGNAASGGADTSPGILTVKTLQCILSGADFGIGRRRQRLSGDDYYEENGADSGISPYDPRFSPAHEQSLQAAITPRRQVVFTSSHQPKAELKRKRCKKKPQPNSAVKTSSLPSIGSGGDTKQSTNAHRTSGATKSLTRGNQSGSAQNLHSEAQGPEQHSNLKQPQQQYPSILSQQQQREGLRQPAASREYDGKLEGEIQWIHQHLPVLKLATAKNSLKLRRQLFAATIIAHFTRAQLRSRWCHWKSVIAEEKQRELLQLSASKLLIQLFQDLSMDFVRAKFQFWKSWMMESQSQEELAACVCIQQFVRHQRKRRDREASQRVTLDLKGALEMMNANTSKIQRAFQTYAHVQRLLTCLRAARQIQHAVRRRQLEKRDKTAVKIQRVYRSYANAKQASLSAMVAHAFKSHAAREIQRYWRSYAVWKHSSLPLIIVGSLVDQVEYLAAVTSIQRHIMGFLCRRHMRKCHIATKKIQSYWRSCYRRQCARRARKMEQISQSTAACCLQRTFKRNRERLRFRKTLQTSARPMYLRARDCNRDCAIGDEVAIARARSFRERFYVEIVKSAVSVIQSSWRKHVKYAAWKAKCAIAVTKLQRFLKRALCMSKWYGLVPNVVQIHHQQVQNAAARCIQQCWQHHEARKEASTNAASLRVLEELASLMRAAMCIQRYYRRSKKKDLWRFVALQVLNVELPRRRAAAECITRLWWAFYDRKQELLRKFDGFGGTGSRMQSSRGMDLASLQHLLITQQLQCERENAAALRIQKMCRQHVDRRNGKLLLQKYKILMRHEMRKRQQRRIIHSFLDERERERAKKQQQKKKTMSSTATTHQSVHQAATGSSTSTSALSRGDTDTSAVSASNSDVTKTGSGDDQDGADLQQFWSDEYQRAYLYNARTGESTWL